MSSRNCATVTWWSTVSGRRTQLALDVLRAHGFTRLWHLDGDFLAWAAKGQPTESASPAPR